MNRRKSFEPSQGCGLRQLVRGAVAVGWLGAFPSLASAAEPICAWLDGLGGSAQARLEGRPEAYAFARQALDARPRGDAAARAQLAIGLAHREVEPGADRAAALRAAGAAASPATRGAVLASLGAVLLELGDHRGAVEAFRAAAAEGTPAVAERARWRAAEALHAGGFAKEAVAAWRPLLIRDPLAESLDPPTRLAYATDLRVAGEQRRAAEILRSIWSASPERPEGGAAGAALLRWRAEGDAIPPFTSDEHLARAYRLVAVGRSQLAQEEIAAAGRAEPIPSPAVLSLANAAVLLALGRPADAAREVAPHATSPDAGNRRGVNLVLARAAARERRFLDAIAAWRAVASSNAPVPGLNPSAQASLRDDAEFFSAWLLLDAGDLVGAASGLAQLARAHPGSRRADDARWFAAWALIRLGDSARADAALRQLEAGAASPKARYWRARVAADPEERSALLHGLVAADPAGYYGLLACARLEASGTACAPPPLDRGPPPLELDSLPDAPRLRQAAALASAGLREEALQELAAVTRPRSGRRAAPVAAELAAFLGDPLLPFRLARDQIGLSRRSLTWSYPDAWPFLVEPAARSAGVDPALLRAVMRRESGFRTEIRSTAGAVGLLQIVPGTSARLASMLQLPEPLAERLEDPIVNVPLGATYLSHLLDRFSEPVLAIAAYNAGPNAVLRWTRDRAGLPLDAWVESIPFRETREYVRAVIENWARARSAAGERPPRVDPDALVKPPPGGVAF